ncbi:ribonuclease J [Pullulanibacillus sp. KACC 23026]|uniref:ribonuclease J n=1 Tax=Pullulanibacillus sp. KACC 23026 TaxID=3028315 RepID=UPI0023B1E89B|nr:ribonuclease J [Pullulanibacillus sp. KACC 23026]WEG14991.1 ribonuclease J [Pullulanibacillus sp. KACC 23026]
MGGVGENGKNMTVIEIDEAIFLVDAGVMLPKDDMLGIDRVIPDFTYLVDRKERIKGLFLTHAHQEQIGGIPYLLKSIKVPIYGSAFTIGMLELLLKEHGLNRQVKLNVIDPDRTLKIGRHRLTFFRTTHDIPDSIGISIHTAQGAIVHTGDFKIDYTPVDGRKFDLNKLTRLGNEGVLCLLSDSYNAERRGKTLSESDIQDHLEELFYFNNGRVITALYASNIHRIQQVVNAAVKTNRKVALDGRYLEKVVGLAVKLGYLDIPKNVLITLDKMDQVKEREWAIITSGPDGDPMTPFTKIAQYAHKKIQPKDTDLFVYASSATPADERNVTRAIDSLMRLGVNVVYGDSVHVSGHGSQEDLKLVLELAKPRYFIPIRGEFRLQKAHMDLAKAMGIPASNVFLVDKGDVVEFIDQQARSAERVPAGHILVDGLGVGDVGNIVLRDRRLLAEDGTVIVVVTLSRETKAILAGPEIITRGFVYVRESEALIEDSAKIVTEVLTNALTQKISEWSALKNGIRDALNRYLYDKTKRRPMILPILMEI